MGLASALSTALTGLTAAETQIDVVGNNLANSQTVGFKESNVAFTTQFLQSLGRDIVESCVLVTFKKAAYPAGDLAFRFISGPTRAMRIRHDQEYESDSVESSGQSS